jgi:glycosyltransferase involved in cell wall biosynthesis
MGGPPVSVNTFCVAGLRVGIETHLAFTFSAKSLDQTAIARASLSAAGVRLLPFRRSLTGLTKSKTWGLSLRMYGWLALHASRYELVVVHGPWPMSSLVAMVSAKLWGARLILVPHESLTAIDMNRKGWPGRIALKKIIRALYFRVCDAIIVASPLELADSRVAARSVRIVVIPHAVYDEQSRTLPEPRQSLHMPPVLGYIGRLHPKKNIDVLIRALAEAPPAVTLRIAGVGEEQFSRSLKELASSLGLDSRIEWLGLVNANGKPAFFASIDLLVMPSLYESFGLVAAEAIMHGVPVIVSPSTGVSGIIESRRCGFIADPTPSAIAATVERILDDPNLFIELSRNALNAARAEVGFAAFAARIQSIYLSILQQRMNDEPGTPTHMVA